MSIHSYCQCWCVDIRNHLASMKFDWQTPKEKLTGETRGISVFCFHFGDFIESYDFTAKQPHDRLNQERFLGILWDSGDYMTYKIEPIPHDKCYPQYNTTFSPHSIPCSFHQFRGDHKSRSRYKRSGFQWIRKYQIKTKIRGYFYQKILLLISINNYYSSKPFANISKHHKSSK